ncbi:S8 family serine peptidase [Evansella halocellulosilytica]|uniref:S8 family serine peptidase n=1 Tax=Evansella halocellulosilytica TaxID=2011013 RepID=UPI00211BDF70|nr:S8 family serine peptidase [Evansella halocellulosilytica]
MKKFLIFTLSLALILLITMLHNGSSQALDANLDKIDSELNDLISSGFNTAEVVITFHESTQDDRISLLKKLGLETAVVFEELPLAGAIVTEELLFNVIEHEKIRGIFYNQELEYDNYSATEQTGVNAVRTSSDFQKENDGFPITGNGVGVVVNDSGVDGTHDDHKLGNNLVQNVAGQLNLNSISGILPIFHLEDVPNTDTSSGHGTHVSGTVGGTGAKSGGKYEGVAPGANIVGYGSGAAIAMLDILGGFEYALVNQQRYNIRVITNSWGSTGDAGNPFNPEDPINIATKKLYDRGILTVFSAGNSGPEEGTISGNYKKAPWVVTVAAAERDQTLTNFSSRGVENGGGTAVVDGEEWEWVDRPTVTSPGRLIISTRVIGTLSALSAANDIEHIEPGYLPYYATMSGTSMAAPHVAGVAALIFEANPSLNPLEVKEIIETTATEMEGYEDWEVGGGFINAYDAVEEAMNDK